MKAALLLILLLFLFPGNSHSQTDTLNAYVHKVYDGDTYTVLVEAGWGEVRVIRARLCCNIDTPEVRGKEKPWGFITRDSVRTWILYEKVKLIVNFDYKEFPLPSGEMLKIRDYEFGKYGRLLTGVQYRDSLDMTFELLDKELADYKEY